MESTNAAESSSSAAAQSNFVQSVGCTLAIDPLAFKVLAYSENCLNMLGVSSSVDLMGSDARDIFTPSSNIAVSQAIATNHSSSIRCPTPIWVQTRTNGRSFYAILHPVVDLVLLIDFEPYHLSDANTNAAETLCNLRLHSLPTGRPDDIDVLCNAMLQDVQKLTGFDRVMVYKFHDDAQGEFLSEIKCPDLEPYMAWPTHIPRAEWFSFKHCRVSMVCDSTSEPAKVIQSPELLSEPLCLDSSTLRAPHACHLQYMDSMGSMASLVLAIQLINSETTSLWGLVVCHHTSPCHIPILDRFACELVLNVFQVELDRILSNQSFLENNVEEREELVDENKELGKKEESGMEPEDEEDFFFGSVVNFVVCQAKVSLKENNLRLVVDIPEEIKNLHLCGDGYKLQIALLGFLYCIADHAPPSPDGWVEVKVSHGLKLSKDGLQFVHLRFRIAHPGEGLPQDLIEEIFGRRSSEKRRRVSLNDYEKIVSGMNGNVCYVREEQNGISYFQIDVEFKTKTAV